MKIQGVPVTVETDVGPETFSSQTQAAYAVLEDALELERGTMSKLFKVATSGMKQNTVGNKRSLTAKMWSDTVEKTRRVYETGNKR
jgi:hypothetical protein